MRVLTAAWHACERSVVADTFGSAAASNPRSNRACVGSKSLGSKMSGWPHAGRAVITKSPRRASNILLLGVERSDEKMDEKNGKVKKSRLSTTPETSS